MLRSVYGFDRAAIAKVLGGLAGMPRVVLEEPDAVAAALSWTWQSLDFADALHLAKARDCDAFVSFDERLGRRAVALGAAKVRLL